jgi:hexosaminidase
MYLRVFLTGMALSVFSVFSLAQEIPVAVIPMPVNIKTLPEPGWQFSNLATLELSDQGQKYQGSFEFRQLGELFSDMLTAPLGYKPLVSAGQTPVKADKSAADAVKKAGQSRICFVISGVTDSLLGGEGYRLEVHARSIIITANEPAGLFYGMQTLLQLLPVGAAKEAENRELGAIRIVDYPRFAWRGLMLDVSRHFFSKEVVKRYIDQMVKYKFNVFHWHLSDDQGWRIEIKSLPALTQIGAWRVNRTGQWWTFAPPGKDEKADYGGYYTQDDIRDVVRYAAQRFVTIVPEIDVPGHSLALIAAYPELSSTGLQYAVNPGCKFYGEVDNALCPGNEKVFEILDKILTEVADLFPGPYIHIGGDEAFKGFWKNCPKCQKRMQEEKLKNVEELQSYFVRRLEKILLSKHKKLIGWDEILEGGLAPEATVMSWRGTEGGIKAAKMGHAVIMTPDSHCYLDLYQGDPTVEPDTYSSLRLKDCYDFEPVPAGIPSRLILGGQANLWTESVYNERHVQYMTWPRSLATAEVLWSPAEKKDWPGFVQRMEAAFARLDSAHVNYARSAYDPVVKMVEEDGQRKISIYTEVPGLDIYYSWDNGNPDPYYPRYTSSLSLPAGATWIRVAAFRNGRPVSRQINLTITELEKRYKDK